MLIHQNKQHGFTIVELLIVIVVIAILAAISIVAYNGIQERAKISKINADLSSIEKAIKLARIQSGTTLFALLRSGSTPAAAGAIGDQCSSKATGTDIASLPGTDTCWTQYEVALNRISELSGMNIRNLKDPWGRPYWIYDVEDRSSTDPCRQDQVGALRYPHVQWDAQQQRLIPYVISDC